MPYLTTSWNGTEEESVYDEDTDSFIMPSSGEMYFYGRHNTIIGNSDSFLTISNSSGIERTGNMSDTVDIQ